MGFHFKSSFPFLERTNVSTLRNPDEWLIEALMGRLNSSAGVTVDPMRAMGVSTVLACVNIISRQLATTPLHVYEKTDKGKVKATSHPLYSLLHDSPNDKMTAAEFMIAMQGNLTLRNNSFALIRKSNTPRRFGSGREIVGLDPIDPCDIQVVDDSVYPFLVKGEKMERSQVLHLRGLSLSGLVGLDTVALGRDAIGLAIALQDDVARFFANGAKVGTILSTDAKLDKTRAEELRERFDSRHKGVGKSSRTAVLSNGLKLINERFSATDSQSKEQRDFQNRVIAQIFNVPLHKIQINDSIPRANNEEQNRQFITDTLRPYAVIWEQAMTMWLLTPAERERFSIGFNLEGLLRGNTKDRMEAYRVGREIGIYSVNEIRGWEKLNTLGPEGDTYLEPMNHQPLGTGDGNADTPSDDDDEEEKGGVAA